MAGDCTHAVSQKHPKIDRSRVNAGCEDGNLVVAWQVEPRIEVSCPPRPPVPDRTETLAPRESSRGAPPAEVDDADDGGHAGRRGRRARARGRSRALRAGLRARARRPRPRRRARSTSGSAARSRSRSCCAATSRNEARFMREALITARLEHPGIVPVHEAGRWPNGDPYYVMKLVEGRTLKEHDRRRTDAARAARPAAARDRGRRRGRLRAQRGRDPPRPQAVEHHASASSARRSSSTGGSRAIASAERRPRGRASPWRRRRPALGVRSYRRCRARSSARPRTCRPSRRAASSSTSAPTSTRSARCSTSCSPARRRTPTPRRRRPSIACSPARRGRSPRRCPRVPGELGDDRQQGDGARPGGPLRERDARSPRICAATRPASWSARTPTRRGRCSARSWRQHRGVVAIALASAIALGAVGVESFRRVVARAQHRDQRARSAPRTRCRRPRSASASWSSSRPSRRCARIRPRRSRGSRPTAIADAGSRRTCSRCIDEALVARRRASRVPPGRLGVRRRVHPRRQDRRRRRARRQDPRLRSRAPGRGGCSASRRPRRDARMLTPDGRPVITGGMLGEVMLWPLAGGAPRTLLAGHRAIRDVGPVALGRWHARARRPRPGLLESVALDRRRADLPRRQASLRTAVASEDWSRQVAVDRRRTPSQRSTGPTTPPRTLGQTAKAIALVQISPAGDLVVVHDGATVWSVPFTGGKLAQARDYDGQADSASSGRPIGKTIALCGDSPRHRARRSRHRREPRAARPHRRALHRAVERGRPPLLSASDDGTARVWTVADGNSIGAPRPR